MSPHSNIAPAGQEGQPHVISLTSCDTSEPTNGTEPSPLPGQHQPQQANGLEATQENKLEDKLEESLVIGETGAGQIEKTDITVENGGGGGSGGGVVGGGGLGCNVLVSEPANNRNSVELKVN